MSVPRTSFSPLQFDTFVATAWNFEPDTGRIELHYRLESQEGTEPISFTETIVVGPTTGTAIETVEKVIPLLHIAAGVSYYKTAACPNVVIASAAPHPRLGELTSALYSAGLGEFAYVNAIAVPRPKVHFCGPELTAHKELPHNHTQPLVAIGGGKDSCVSVEMLLAAGHVPTLASVNHARPIVQTMDVTGLDRLHATRSLSPALFELNKIGAYNGHVPVTAIVSLILAALALANNKTTVIMSNERSASTGNLHYDGLEINHQYSKSLAFETLLADLLREFVASNFSYFSLLRPFSELAIARRFARTDKYDTVFTSCNRAFTIDNARRIDHWCGHCDKCRFVFLILAPFMNPERLVSIFGHNLLQDTTQAAGFDALVGHQADKPFECVGEVEESIAAFLLLAERDEWKHCALVRRFSTDVAKALPIPPNVTELPFRVSTDHNIDPAYELVINEID